MSHAYECKSDEIPDLENKMKRRTFKIYSHWNRIIGPLLIFLFHLFFSFLAHFYLAQNYRRRFKTKSTKSETTSWVSKVCKIKTKKRMRCTENKMDVDCWLLATILIYWFQMNHLKFISLENFPFFVFLSSTKTFQNANISCDISFPFLRRIVMSARALMKCLQFNGSLWRNNRYITWTEILIQLF